MAISVQINRRVLEVRRDYDWVHELQGDVAEIEAATKEKCLSESQELKGEKRIERLEEIQSEFSESIRKNGKLPSHSLGQAFCKTRSPSFMAQNERTLSTKNSRRTHWIVFLTFVLELWPYVFIAISVGGLSYIALSSAR